MKMANSKRKFELFRHLEWKG